MILGINHINLSITNIDRSFYFYHEILGLKPLCKWPHGAYLLAGDDWFCLNVTNDKAVVIRQDYTHYALSVSAENFFIIDDSLLNFVLIQKIIVISLSIARLLRMLMMIMLLTNRNSEFD